MANEFASGASGGFGGAAQGVQIGAAFGNPLAGAIIGGVLGIATGIFGAGESRGEFRANRRAEFLRNQSLKLRSSLQAKAGASAVGAAKAAAGAAGVKGATIDRALLDTLTEVNRARIATLSGLSNEFQSGSGKAIPADERPSLPTTPTSTQRQRAGIRGSDRSPRAGSSAWNRG